MMSRSWFRRTYGIVSGVFLGVLAFESLIAQQSHNASAEPTRISTNVVSSSSANGWRGSRR